MAAIKGAELIVDFLIRRGVPYVFGLCGHGILGFLDAVYDRRDELKAISVHHEACAAFMADAYFRVAQRPVATFTSCGPGSTNLVPAIASAFMDSSAFLAITGNVPTSQWNRGPFQESGRYFQGEFVNVLRPYVKRSFQPTRADMLPLALRQAYTLMLSGRPGPVHLDVPLNVFVETVEREEAERELWDCPIASRAGADPADLQEALRLLLSAQRPVIVAGHGVELSQAESELLRLAEQLSIPVVTTPLGKGVIDARHRLSLGATGRNGSYPANAATRNADVILALGTRFDDRSTSSWLPGFTYRIPPTRLIHVDIDPSEIGRNYQPAVGIVGDIRTVLRQLLEALSACATTALETRAAARRSWLEKIGEWQRKWEAHVNEPRRSEAVPLRPERVISELRAALPEDAIVVSDVGVHHNWLVSAFPAYRSRTLLQSFGFASMGFGVAGALGAKLAAPERSVVSVCGDGGFLMWPGTVATAVEYAIPVVWLVWNNYGYCSIRDQQLGYFGSGRELVTSFVEEQSGRLFSADFAALARAMGADGYLVERPGDLGDLLHQALTSGRPTVLDVRVDREVRPPATASWELPPLPHPLPNFGWQEDQL
ncbi:MAG: thiamine pyrophosphate-binding protein [Thermogemmatispora sp.]|uniref:thiamine pyrophosphate-binding protein n=1 Tax=Thermogemmatispora sp. TaxID=1968838 RepID=UPI0026257E34|nr:thiamine pyrophosphate-binding protein [Thermogemmatispora sp.]MBX5457876.1 thiamine pyrophosphate-binding protein [Thermogemmatispora sp.]